MKNYLVAVYCLLTLGLGFGQNNIMTKSNPETFNITISVTSKNNGLSLSDLIVNIPLPSNSNTQEIHDVNTNNGVILSGKDFDYVSFVYDKNNSPKNGKTAVSSVSYKVTIYEQVYNLQELKTIEPYDKTSEVFQNYTKENLPFIKLNNTSLLKASDSLWKKSKGNILKYAELVYEYIPINFNYINPNTGLHPLDDIVKSGGGDCGNLSSVFISMLRMKEIPSRYVVAIRANNTFHVWAEFYIESVGWIPVDVTYKKDYPNKDWFGRISEESNGIVLNKDINLSLLVGNRGNYNIDLFQTYGFWYWYTSGTGSVDNSYIISRNN